jgi:hypothetical protein
MGTLGRPSPSIGSATALTKNCTGLKDILCQVITSVGVEAWVQAVDFADVLRGVKVFRSSTWQRFPLKVGGRLTALGHELIKGIPKFSEQ